jgi:hypothetical protein
MKAFETTTTVAAQGDIRLIGVPFAPGTEVEVTINPKRKSAAEFVDAWEQVCREIRSQPAAKEVTDDEIQKEIEDYRAGR